MGGYTFPTINCTSVFCLKSLLDVIEQKLLDIGKAFNLDVAPKKIKKI